MGRSNLDTAKRLLRRRKFELAISILESYEDVYDGDFEYYLALGIAYLYADVPGKASQNFRNARGIKIKSPQLLLGQAAIFLRHGETDRALQYYLDVLEIDPGNSIAKEAMEFIRLYGDYTTICKWVDSGDIRKFYPPLGMNPDIIRNCIFSGLLIGLFCSALIVINPAERLRTSSKTAELDRKFSLSEDELKNAVQLSVSEADFSIILSPRQVASSFSAAKSYFASGRDNAARVELNRILSSNAAVSIKAKASEIAMLLKEPTFDSLKDNFSYAEVQENPFLYQNCYVIWDGTAASAVMLPDGSWECNFLVNYIPSEKKYTMDGSIRTVFDREHAPSINEEKPVRFLSQIVIENGAVFLSGRGAYQQLKGTSLGGL